MEIQTLVEYGLAAGLLVLVRRDLGEFRKDFQAFCASIQASVEMSEKRLAKIEAVVFEVDEPDPVIQGFKHA